MIHLSDIKQTDVIDAFNTHYSRRKPLKSHENTMNSLKTIKSRHSSLFTKIKVCMGTH